jgi:hypothetical protein
MSVKQSSKFESGEMGMLPQFQANRPSALMRNSPAMVGRTSSFTSSDESHGSLPPIGPMSPAVSRPSSTAGSPLRTPSFMMRTGSNPFAHAPAPPDSQSGKKSKKGKAGGLEALIKPPITVSSFWKLYCSFSRRHING